MTMRAMVRRRQYQAGFTVVEMIVAVAVLALVIATIAPTFYLLNRIYTSWGDTGQARAVGLTAEAALQRDVRSTGIVPGQPADRLVLQGVPQPGDAGNGRRGQSTYCITYRIGGFGSTGLVRIVTYPGQSQNPVSSFSVAHGVTGLVTSPAGNSVQVTLTLAGTDGKPVVVEPPLTLTQRVDRANWQPWVCP
jgi:prepilin-type N-terminal cleavage/methylation domain-containing protein